MYGYSRRMHKAMSPSPTPRPPVDLVFDELEVKFEAQSQPAPASVVDDSLPKSFWFARHVIGEIKSAVGEEPFWIAGGALAALAAGLPVNDFDTWGPNPERLIEALSASPKFKKGFSNENFTNFKLGNYTVQVITRFKFQTMDETIDRFDFAAVAAAYDGKKFVCHDRFWMDAASKTIVAANSDRPFLFPLSSMERVIKYTRKGYTTCPMLLKSLLKQINEATIDWENPSEDTLTFYPDGTPRFTGID